MSFGRAISREERRQLRRDNAKLPAQLERVPRDEWPERLRNSDRREVWRSRDYLVQVIDSDQPGVLVRLSINRTTVDGDSQRWHDGLSWDELQRIKGDCGYGRHDAVEVYPPDIEVVNDANMRHLWVMRMRLPFGWTTGGGER